MQQQQPAAREHKKNEEEEGEKEENHPTSPSECASAKRGKDNNGEKQRCR